MTRVLQRPHTKTPRDVTNLATTSGLYRFCLLPHRSEQTAAMGYLRLERAIKRVRYVTASPYGSMQSPAAKLGGPDHQTPGQLRGGACRRSETGSHRVA